MAKIAFKSDNQNQIQLLPPSLDDLILSTHPVRVLNSIVDRLDVSKIFENYRGGGNSCFHPRMMLKIWIYAYLNNIYSSRKLERQLHEHIHYMWLSGGARPDFRTLNYFRGKRLQDSFEGIFTQVVELLHSEGFVSLEVQYIDGTKIESASNKYTFVWRRSVEKYDARLREKTRRSCPRLKKYWRLRLSNLHIQEISQNYKSLIIKCNLECLVNLNLSEYLLLFQILGVYLGVEFQTHPIMNIKRNIIFALESRKKNGVPIVENVPIRMRVIYASQRIEFTTGYRIDVAKWDADKQRVKNGCTNKLKQSLDYYKAKI